MVLRRCVRDLSPKNPRTALGSASRDRGCLQSFLNVKRYTTRRTLLRCGNEGFDHKRTLDQFDPFEKKDLGVALTRYTSERPHRADPKRIWDSGWCSRIGRHLAQAVAIKPHLEREEASNFEARISRGSQIHHCLGSAPRRAPA